MKSLSPRMNARIWPSGDKAGVDAESVKSVGYVYLMTTGWGREERYTAVPMPPSTAQTPATSIHHRALCLPVAAGAGAGPLLLMATSGYSGRTPFLTAGMKL